MKWLLKFIPFNSIIDYICSFIKKIWTFKTGNNMADFNSEAAAYKIIDEILKPILLHWKDYALNPSIDIKTAFLENVFTIIDFLDEDGLKIIRTHISEKQKELAVLKKEEENGA